MAASAAELPGECKKLNALEWPTSILDGAPEGSRGAGKDRMAVAASGGDAKWLMQLERRGNDPHGVLPPGVHLFGLRKVFLRSKWWMPQFWLAKGAAGEARAAGTRQKPSLLSR